MRSLSSLMMVKFIILWILACCWFWTVLAEILGHSNMTSVDNHIKHWIRCMLCGVILVMGVLELLLLLHLLLLLELLGKHLLLLVLAQPIELVVLHCLLLLNRHCSLFIRISKEIILFHVRLINLTTLSCWTIKQLALICLHNCWLFSMALMSAISVIVLQAVEILLRDW